MIKIPRDGLPWFSARRARRGTADPLGFTKYRNWGVPRDTQVS